MTKLPLYVWCVGDAHTNPDRLHDRLEPIVEYCRFGSANDFAKRLVSGAAVPDVALIEHWDAGLATQFGALPRVWLDPEAASHGEITVADVFDDDCLVTALITAANLGRARVVRDAMRTQQQAEVAPSRQPLPDLDDFALHFQAQWSIDGSSLTGAETLLRWNGLPVPNLRPESMIAAAEQRGDMRRLGDWIMHRACRHAADWRLIWPDTMRLSINISPLQLAADDFVKVLGAALAENRIDPTLIELEVPVSALPRLAERHDGMVADLYDLGIGFALDGLGKDVLDPGLLTWLPATSWKLHRSLIARLPADRAVATLIATLVEAARAQRIVTVAVGVEREDQRVQLQALGCDALQGFLFADALAPQEFGALLAAHGERQRPGV
jgi:EAL domain-containing protein (putative c-di-GMP-specific phosphodiesterase class I)